MENNEDRSKQIANIVKTGITVVSWYEFIRLALFVLIFTGVIVFFITKGLPIYIGIVVIIVLWAFSYLVFYRAKKVTNVDLDQQGVHSYEENVEAITIDPAETVKFKLPGVMRQGFMLRSVSGPSGIGEIRQPENAMIVTDRHILLITIPMPGSDKVVDGTDLGMADWLMTSKEISAKLDELISSQSLSQIFGSDPRNFGFSLGNVEAISFSDLSHSIEIKLKTGNKYKYAIRDSELYTSAKHFFGNQ